MNLTSKFVALLLLIALIPLVAMGSIAWFATRDLEDEAGAHFADVAADISDKIDRNLFERYGDVQAFALNRVLYHRDYWYKTAESENEITTVLNQYVDTYDLYYLSIFVDTKGRVIAVNSKDQDGKPVQSESIFKKNYGNTSWFKACESKNFTTKMPFTAPGNDQSNGTYIEDVHLDEDVKTAYPGDDGLALGFSAPVYENGNVIGYISNRAKFSAVEGIIGDAQAELVRAGFPNAEVTLLDSTGNVIIDYIRPPDAKDWKYKHDFNVLFKLNLAKAGLAPAQSAIEGKSGFAWATHVRKKIEQAAGYTHLKGALGYPGMNWALLARSSREEVSASAGIMTIRRNLIIAGAVSLMICIIASLIAARLISKPICIMSAAAERIAKGDVKQKVEYRSADEIGKLADSFRSLIEYVDGVATAANALAKGDLTVKITERSGQDELSRNMAAANTTLNRLITESQQLIHAAHEGRLKERANSRDFEGAYRDLVEGMNQMLDAIAKPVSDGCAALERVAAGDVSREVTGEYKGDLRAIKDSINNTMRVLNQLHAETTKLIEASRAGKLSVRASAGQFEGNYKELCNGINSMLDAIVEPIHAGASSLQLVAAGDLNSEVKGNFQGDHRIIQDNINNTIRVLRSLLAEVRMLIDSARAGELAVRADEGQFQGTYRELCIGVNMMLDAVVRPMNEGSEVLQHVAARDLTQTVRGEYKGDHATMKNNINKMIADLGERIHTIGQHAQLLASASEELSATNQQMSTAAASSTEQATRVSTTSSRVSNNVESVASATEEMSASIREISKNTNNAARVANEALQLAKSTDQRVTRLGESSAEIGEVIKVITSIAQQTNLLALNATIEAARAGEAGKGFAVVADEVKNLANETAKATEDISSKIATIQTETVHSVKAIQEILGVIQQIHDIQNTIAGAVEEQSATTVEMSRSVNEAAAGSREIANNIQGLADTVHHTSDLVTETERASQDLARMADELQGLVREFKLSGDSEATGRATKRPALAGAR